MISGLLNDGAQKKVGLFCFGTLLPFSVYKLRRCGVLCLMLPLKTLSLRPRLLRPRSLDRLAKERPMELLLQVLGKRRFNR